MHRSNYLTKQTHVQRHTRMKQNKTKVTKHSVVETNELVLTALSLPAV